MNSKNSIYCFLELDGEKTNNEHNLNVNEKCEIEKEPKSIDGVFYASPINITEEPLNTDTLEENQDRYIYFYSLTHHFAPS